MAVRKREIVELVITAILLITIMVMIQIIIKEENEKHIKTIKFVMGSSITLTLVCCFPNKYSISCVWHRRVTRKLLFLSFSFHRRYGRDNQCLRYRNRMNMKQFLVVALSPFHLVRSLMFM